MGLEGRDRRGGVESPFVSTGKLPLSRRLGPGHAPVERRGVKAALLVGIAALALAIVPAATADVASEKALAERYAPVVRLVEHNGDCGPGKPYMPIDVDALFGQPTVALRGPWGGADLVKIGPTADDLSKDLFEYHLDFPGARSHPGAPTCSGSGASRRDARRPRTPTS